MLNNVQRDEFGEWVSKLLSLDGERSADRLQAVLDELKKCSLNLIEMKRAFTMYVNGDFPLEPRDNYLTVIQYTKVINCYIADRNKKNKFKEQVSVKISEEDKENIMLEAVDRVQKEYEQNGKITGAITHVYDYLHAKKKFPKHTKEFRNRILKKAKKIAKSEVMIEAGRDFEIHRQLNELLQGVETGENDKIKPISKRLVLEEYFKNK